MNVTPTETQVAVLLAQFPPLLFMHTLEVAVATLVLVAGFMLLGVSTGFVMFLLGFLLGI